MSRLVSGEAVELELRYAQLASRCIALLIDVLLQFLMLAVLLGVLFAADPALDDAMYAALTIVIIVVVMIGYPVTLETLTRGRTVGKFVMGLRVTRDDGGPIRFRHALIRGLTGFFVDFWVLGLLGTVAVVVSLISKDSKRVGDFLAGTVVIRERLPIGGNRPVEAGLQRAAWTSSLDVSGLSPELLVAVRQYLTRYPAFSAAAQEDIGRSLAGEVSARVGGTRPRELSDAQYLDHILAEYRAREKERSHTGSASRRSPADRRDGGDSGHTGRGTPTDHPFTPPQ